MKKVYFSVSEDIANISIDDSSDHKFIERLNEICDLHLVHPCEYNFDSGTVMASYQYVNSKKIILKQKEHRPNGDLFIIFSDGSNKNRGLDFAINEYHFLKNLKYDNSFEKFFNEPETEELTLKSYLTYLSKDNHLGIAKTMEYNYDNLERLLEQYGKVIAKPIFGCQMTGVQMIKEVSEFNENLTENYILQEPLFGPEKRIVVMDGQVIMARIHQDRKNPWNKGSASIQGYLPTSDEINIAINNTKSIGAYLAGVDFIGSKVNEINGSGTGIRYYDSETKKLIDKTPDLVNYIVRNFL